MNDADRTDSTPDARERLRVRGVGALSTAELLALLLDGRGGEEALARACAALEGGGFEGARMAIDARGRSSSPELDPYEIIEIARALTEERARAAMTGETFLTSHALVRDYLVARLGRQRREEMGCLFLDAAFRVMGYEAISVGSSNSVLLHPREVARKGLELDAVACVLVHQHPSKSTHVSEEDLVLTREAFLALRLIGISLIDHLLIAGDTMVSIADTMPSVFDPSSETDGVPTLRGEAADRR